MKEKNIKNWENFEKEIEGVFVYVSDLKKKTKMSVSDPLFRGQSDSRWSLNTTLDRIKAKISMYEYYCIIRGIKPSIESFTNSRWELPEFTEPDKGFWLSFPMETYAYMIYLRHHNFPSPLLDWTRSPYIAAFFAFHNVQLDKDVTVFAYIEDLGQGKTSVGENPTISSQGPYVTTHKRHHLQQCEYTICTKKENGKAYYWQHEDVFSRNDSEQDFLIKYILPSSARKEFLKKLELMNVTAYSLFGSEESLMHSLSIREFFLHN